MTSLMVDLWFLCLTSYEIFSVINLFMNVIRLACPFFKYKIKDLTNFNGRWYKLAKPKKIACIDGQDLKKTIKHIIIKICIKLLNS